MAEAAPGALSSASLRLTDLVKDPALYRILIDHAHRGVRVQLWLRAVLVVFVCLVVAIIPPAHDPTACDVIAGIYAAWSVVVAVVARQPGELVVRFIWLALFVDLVALAGLTLVASDSAAQSWTADVLVNGFFVLPLLAATQLRTWVCAVITIPTVVVYLATSIASRQANGEPWSSVLLRTAVLAGLCAGCVLQSRVARSRVLTIGGLVANRNDLLLELVTIEGRERRELAEELHDGALQYVLAARQELDVSSEGMADESLERVDHALKETSALLRSTVGQLHPAVLDQVGLVTAVRDIVEAAGRRGGFVAEVDTSGWDDGTRTSADPLLFSAARELLSNVARHANARVVRVQLSLHDTTARLSVVDDGRGLGAGELERRLGEGHIGVASQRVRVEAAGGRFTVRAAQPNGTSAEIEVPAIPLPELHP
jgi:two-component system, NarL family, sensor kinase